MPGILIIGYGNTLRSDDGVGPRVARLLDRDCRRDPNITVIACHQLTPELAPAIAGAERLILIDAEAGGPPGKIWSRELLPEPAGCVPLTHHIAPQGLLAMAELLYGHAPRTTLHTVCGGSFDPGEDLSPAVEAAAAILRGAVKEDIHAASTAL
jgi:hydrogenase maturation protease